MERIIEQLEKVQTHKLTGEGISTNRVTRKDYTLPENKTSLRSYANSQCHYQYLEIPYTYRKLEYLQKCSRQALQIIKH